MSTTVKSIRIRRFALGLLALPLLSACAPAPSAVPPADQTAAFSYKREMLRKGSVYNGITQSDPSLMTVTYAMQCENEASYKAASGKIAAMPGVVSALGPNIIREGERRRANAVTQPLGCTVTLVQLTQGSADKTAIVQWLVQNPQAMSELKRHR